MYKIGIIGHSPEHFSVPSAAEVRKTINNTIDLLALQYGPDSVMFNVAGDIGVGLWASEICMNKQDPENPCNDFLAFKCAYHMFMPYIPERTADGWFDDQAETLNRCYQKAKAITICNEPVNAQLESLKQLVNDSSFVICFWIGKKQGKTFETIKYALSTNKMVLNGLDGLRMITNQDLKKWR
jgi:hypothetical protein